MFKHVCLQFAVQALYIVFCMLSVVRCTSLSKLPSLKTKNVKYGVSWNKVQNGTAHALRGNMA